MIFSGYAFLLVFLPCLFVGFYGLRHLGALRSSVSLLLFASFAFYAYWSLTHLALLLTSIGANFFIARYIAGEHPKSIRRMVTTLGVIGNLLLIFVFKYLDFTATTIADLSGNEWRLLNLLLPLGISFFTFQQIAYLIDSYTTQSHERSLSHYALFVSFFPQLIAGPIVHHNHTRPQFNALATQKISPNYLPYGIMIFALGLAKKTLIADPIAPEIDPIYAAAAAGTALSGVQAWLATIGYTLQIYFDFSGYCDMAIGLGLMFGIRLPVNFNSPYKSKSIIEFWRRWHITLSNFLRDYIYIPFGGNRVGQLFRLRNIFLTMLIGGIWHGAAWTFVIWGAIHATLITLNHAMRIYLPAFDNWKGLTSTIVKRAATLGAVMIAWIFFRAESPAAGIEIMTALTSITGDLSVIAPEVLVLMIFASAVALFAPNSLEIAGYTQRLDEPLPVQAPALRAIMRPTPISALASAIMLGCGIAVAWKPAVFLYFNF